MIFKKLNLDESLFDDELVGTDAKSDLIWSDYDDDFSEPDYLPQQGRIPTGPMSPSNNGVADTLMTLINDEWEAIKGYNVFVEQLQANIKASGDASLQMMLPVIDDIRNEENKHVGQLQELLKLISPNAASIDDGARESHQQFKFVDGKLPVQAMMSPVTSDNSAMVNEIGTECTIYDVDDDM